MLCFDYIQILRKPGLRRKVMCYGHNLLQEQQAEYARETADFDILKAAFSQNGVPFMSRYLRCIVSSASQ